MSRIGVVLALALFACSGGSSSKPSPTTVSNDAVVDTPPAPSAIPSRIAGHYALAATATHTAPITHARVFVTLDATGAAHAGTIGNDALDAGALVSLPRQAEHGTDDAPPGTPLLRDTVTALLGPGAPARVLDDASREELRTSGCTHWPRDQPRGVSWGFSNEMRFEVLAFAQSAGDPTPAEATVLVADAAAPAIRLIQAADDVPVARIAIDTGGPDAAALDIVVGGAVSIGDPVCIAANRSVQIENGTVDVRGDGIKHPSFGTIAIAPDTGVIDHDALVTAYKAALAANQLDMGQTVVQVDHTIKVATLVAVIDAMLEAGETRFVLHAWPDLSPPRRTRPPRPPTPKGNSSLLAPRSDP